MLVSTSCCTCLRKAIQFQALPHEQACAMQQYPAVGRRDTEFLTNFLGFHAGDLAQSEHLGHGGLQAVGTLVQHAPQLAEFGLGLRIAPGAQWLRPVAILLEQEVDGVLGQFVGVQLAACDPEQIVPMVGQPGLRGECAHRMILVPTSWGRRHFRGCCPKGLAGLLISRTGCPRSCVSATFVNQKEDTMSNMTRYDPFETDSLDNLFRGFFRPVKLDRDMPQIRMDVKEDETGYAVHADIPGVNKDDIHITIDGNTVSISAETKKLTEQKDGEKVLRRERYVGRVGRSFALEHEVDEASASARYQDGVLELVLPKKAAAAAKRVAVQYAGGIGLERRPRAA